MSGIECTLHWCSSEHRCMHWKTLCSSTVSFQNLTPPPSIEVQISYTCVSFDPHLLIVLLCTYIDRYLTKVELWISSASTLKSISPALDIMYVTKISLKFRISWVDIAPMPKVKWNTRFSNPQIGEFHAEWHGGRN